MGCRFFFLNLNSWNLTSASGSCEWIKVCTHTISVQSKAAVMDFPVCNLIVLSCQYEWMAVACKESGYLSTCVSVQSAYFLYQCVYVCLCVCVCTCTCMFVWWCVTSACPHFWSFPIWPSTCVCCWHFWTEELYPPSRSPFNARHCRHTHITHPAADTHMSPRQPDTAKDMLLTEKQRPPHW